MMPAMLWPGIVVEYYHISLASLAPVRYQATGGYRTLLGQELLPAMADTTPGGETIPHQDCLHRRITFLLTRRNKHQLVCDSVLTRGVLRIQWDTPTI